MVFVNNINNVASVNYSLYVSSDVLDQPKVQPFFVLNIIDSNLSISVPELPVFIEAYELSKRVFQQLG